MPKRTESANGLNARVIKDDLDTSARCREEDILQAKKNSEKRYAKNELSLATADLPGVLNGSIEATRINKVEVTEECTISLNL